MEFKYALSLLFSNMGYVIRIFVWVLIAMIITACIGAAVLVPVFDALGEAPEVADAFRTLTGELDSFLDDGMSIREFISSIPAAVGGLVAAVVGESGLCAALAFTAIFLYALYSFIVSLSYYPTAYSVKQLMSSNMRIGLPSSMALNFKQAVKFAACRVSIALPIDIALIILAVLLVWGLFTAVGVFAFPITILLGIIVVSLRSAFFGGWLPRLLFVEGESMYTAFGRSLRAVKLNLKGLMKAFVITFFAAFALMAGLSVPTFGLVIIVIPSLNYFLFRTIELVGYYKMTGMSFYTDAANVVDTVEFGYRAENQARLSEEDPEE